MGGKSERADRDEESSARHEETSDEDLSHNSHVDNRTRTEAAYALLLAFQHTITKSVSARRKATTQQAGLSPELIEKRTKRHLEELEVRIPYSSCDYLR